MGLHSSAEKGRQMKGEAAHVLPTWGTSRFLYAKGYKKSAETSGDMLCHLKSVWVAIRHEEGSSGSMPIN